MEISVFFFLFFVVAMIFEVAQLIFVLRMRQMPGMFFFPSYALVFALSVFYVAVFYILIGGPFDLLSYFMVYVPVLKASLW